MDPVFIEIFGRPIYWYGVMTALGFLAAVAHWAWLGRNEPRPEGIASELGIWVMVGGILGARIAYIAANFDQQFRHNLLDVVRIDKGGLVYYGGFIGATLGIMLLARLRRQPLWDFGDFVITAVPLGHAIGRIGCFLNGCCYGKPSALPWAIHRHPLAEGGHAELNAAGLVHPTQLYECAFNVAVYLLLLRQYRRKRRDGTVFALYLILYPSGRFLLEFARGDPRMQWMGLTVAQGLSLVLLAVGCALWFLLPERPQADDA